MTPDEKTESQGETPNPPGNPRDTVPLPYPQGLARETPKIDPVEETDDDRVDLDAVRHGPGGTDETSTTLPMPGEFHDDIDSLSEGDLPLLGDKNILGGKYQLVRYHGQEGLTRVFTVVHKVGDQRASAVLRAIHISEAQKAMDPDTETNVKQTPVVQQNPSASSSTLEVLPQVGHTTSAADTVVLGVGMPVNLDLIQILHGLYKDRKSPAFPILVDYFEEDGYRILVERPPLGVPILQAWNNRDVPLSRKIAWLEQLRQALVAIHEKRLIFPYLQPNRIVVSQEGVVGIRDLSGVAPLPLSVPMLQDISLYAAPELTMSPNRVDFRSDIFTFGAVCYALLLGRELTEKDFEYRGVPRPLSRFMPEAYPPLIRLVGKSFVHIVELRFPTAKARLKDPTGIEELGAALLECALAARNRRYEIASWTNTGIIRNANEDGFAVRHVLSDCWGRRREIALICLTDGMGGYAGGEVASALAIGVVTESLEKAGVFSTPTVRPQDGSFNDDLRELSNLLKTAVLDANKRIREAATQDSARREMGCTLDAVLLVNSSAAVCHVGDSRVYHRSGTTLRQITRDQTLVNQLVELGHISQAEAAVHPRRSELFQAVGAQDQLDPGRYMIDLEAGDWLMVCSDGLTNHINDREIASALTSSDSAEAAARRLVNLANTRGGGDNITVVAVRVH